MSSGFSTVPKKTGHTRELCGIFEQRILKENSMNAERVGTSGNRYFYDPEVNFEFDLETTEDGTTIICSRWFPQRMFIPQKIWRSFVKSPHHGHLCDNSGYLWDWALGGDYYASISSEKLNGIDRGRKEAVRIPRTIWLKMLGTELG